MQPGQTKVSGRSRQGGHGSEVVVKRGWTLSFARRSLACQEDTEVLALCAQVSSRLKELSQLTLDCTDTEEIEATKVELITEGAVQRQSPATWLTCGYRQLNAPRENYNLVGKLQSTTGPVIKITTDKLKYQISRGEQCDIQVRAEVKINGNIARKNTKLSISAKEIIKYKSRKYNYDTYHHDYREY